MDLVQLLRSYAAGRRDFDHLDLREAWMPGIQLQGVALQQADLTGANLSYGIFKNVNLAGAMAWRVKLAYAQLDQTSWERAILIRADLTDSCLVESCLTAADLRLATLQGSNLSLSNLTHSRLCYANLMGCNLRGANLSQADLTGALLRGADLTGCTLRGAIFKQADLTDAIGVDRNLPMAV